MGLNGFKGTNGKGNRDLSEDECKQAWGGGKPCSDFKWEEWRECGTQPCPIDCVMSQWGEWEPCTKNCGKGETWGVRVIETHPAHGGVECPTQPEHADADTTQHGYSTTHGCHSPPCKTWVRDSKPCNDHSCGKHCTKEGSCHSYPASCNLEHVHCHVKWLTHHRSNKQIRKDLSTCGHSAIEESNTCWNNLDGLGNTCKRDGTLNARMASRRAPTTTSAMGTTATKCRLMSWRSLHALRSSTRSALLATLGSRSKMPTGPLRACPQSLAHRHAGTSGRRSR